MVSSPFLTNLGEGFVNSVGPERQPRYADADLSECRRAAGGIIRLVYHRLQPWVGIHAAVNRTTATGRDLGKETEALTPEEALRSYTLGGAYVTGREDRQGSMSRASWPIWSCWTAIRWPFAPNELDQVRPIATCCGGVGLPGVGIRVSQSPLSRCNGTRRCRHEGL